MCLGHWTARTTVALGTELITHHMSGQAKPAPAPVQDEDDEFEE